MTFKIKTKSLRILQASYDNQLAPEEDPLCESWQEYIKLLNNEDLLDLRHESDTMIYDPDYRKEMTKRGLTFYL